MSQISLDKVSKQFADVKVIREVSLDIEHGEFVVIIGPSGCGKSTLLRLIAGLEDITAGTITIDGQVMNEVPAKSRGVAMVFQSYALYPHMTVAENMAFSLKMSRVKKAEIRSVVESTAATLQLTELLERYPRQLSGGQRQRVAIGRAIVRRPGVFLFDEPLSNLDAALRAQTRLEIADLHRETGGTSVYVTHDQVEAMTLADRIVVLNKGRIEQTGTPLQIYRKPSNLFVAEFIGTPRINVLPAKLAASGGSKSTAVSIAGQQLEVPRNLPASGENVNIGIRPEHIVKTDAAQDNCLSGRIRYVEHLGESNLVHVLLQDGSAVVLRDYTYDEFKQDEQVFLQVDWRQALFFSADGLLMT